MDAPRSFASLRPALLARKGGARPAMRNQLGAAPSADDPAGDHPADNDLGWNDFGHDDCGPDHGDATAGDLAAAYADERVVPISRLAIPRRTPRDPGRPGRAALEASRKAAFTLRLDPERHLRLRLACALDARSAQALVTDALDRLLAAIPELEPLAEEAASARRAKAQRSRRPSRHGKS